MRKFFISALTGILVGLSACSGSPSQDAEATGPWSLVSRASHVTYTTIKKGDIAEPNSFDQLDGSVTPAGVATVEIFLDSVKTLIDTRDERMRKFVFQTDKFPVGTVTTKLDMSTFSGLATGERTETDSEITVTLAGLTESFDATFRVTRLGPNRVLVEDAQPVMVHADDFNVMPGVETLRELAGLDTITPVVPVSFSLVFKR